MSVLGTFTPLGERSRGGSFGRTATLYILASTTAAALLGLLLNLVTAPVLRLLHASTHTLLIAGVLGLTLLAVDLSGRTARLPHLHRQVSDRWLGRFRPAIYALGFGAQLGLGFTTHMVTAATYAVFAYAALTQQAALAVIVAGVYGLTRGSLVFLGASVDDPYALARLHHRVLGSEHRIRRGLRVAEGVAAGTAVLLSIFV
jgi:hypothetical protein